jgi:hypothetical protein
MTGAVAGEAEATPVVPGVLVALCVCFCSGLESLLGCGLVRNCWAKTSRIMETAKTRMTLLSMPG